MILAALDNFHALLALPPSAIGPVGLFLALFAVSVFGANLVASLAGFGGTLLALPLVAWLCGEVPLAVIAVLLLGTVQCAMMAAVNFRDVRWRALGLLLAWSALGLPLGLVLATRLPPVTMLMTMGVIVLIGGVSGFFAAPSEVESRPLRSRDRALLVVAGILHGAAGCGGPTAVLVARYTLPAKEAFRATLFVFWVGINSLALSGLAVRSSLTGLPLMIACGLPCVIAANLVGQRLAGRATQQWFGKFVASLLVLAGIVTIARCFFQS